MIKFTTPPIKITVYKMNESHLASIQFWLIFLSTILIMIIKPKTAIYKIILIGGVVNLIISFATMNTI